MAFWLKLVIGAAALLSLTGIPTALAASVWMLIYELQKGM